MSLLPTSSTGSPRPRWRWSSPLSATPSRIRSRPARQVFCSKRCIWKRARWSPSMPQRMPACPTQRVIRSRSSSLNPNRCRHAGCAARSSTSEAATRPPASSTSEAATASSGLVLVSARSAIRTRRRWAGCPPPSASSTTSARPNPAETSGAKVSMSGHITRMSRGCEGLVVGEQPHEHLAQDVDLPGRTVAGVDLQAAVGRVVGARGALLGPGAWLARRSCWSIASRVVGAPPVVARPARARPRPAPRGYGAARGCRGRARRAAGDRRQPPRCPRRGRPRRRAPPAPSHRAGEGCGSHRCTSREVASACSSRTSVAGSRVCPNSESRSGRSSPAPPASSAATVRAQRTSGASASTRSRSRCHSRACHSRSLGEPAAGTVGEPSLAPVGDQLRALHGVRRVQAGDAAGDRVAPVAPQAGRLLVEVAGVAEVAGQVGAPRLVERVVDRGEQRPDEPVGVPHVVAVAVEQQRDQRARVEEPDARHTPRRRRAARPRAGATAAG